LVASERPGMTLVEEKDVQHYLTIAALVGGIIS
jgi:hypothetical protein